MTKEKNYNTRIPIQLWLNVISASLLLRHRSFAADATYAVSGILPQTSINGLDNIPLHGPCLITCNHYTSPDLDAWWGPFLISTAVASQRRPPADCEIHWVMTAAWTFPNHPWRRKYLTPLTHWAFQRVATVYGFISMPPMPPASDEVYARATAVRQTLRLAHRIAPKGGMIGLAPEGRDTVGVVGSVPKGVGDFITHLCKAGLPVLPVAVSQSLGYLHVTFGPTFQPVIPRLKAERDNVVSQQVMDAIQKLVV